MARTPGGRMAARCSDCKRARDLAKRRADLAAERRADSPSYQRRKEQARETYSRVRADPVAYADRMQKARENYKKRAQDAEWQAATGRKTRDKRLRKLYGADFGIDAYDAMLAAQDGCCAICRQVPDNTFHVDHCHATGKVRGVLCGACNNALGLMKDDVARMAAAIDYLKRSA